MIIMLEYMDQERLSDKECSSGHTSLSPRGRNVLYFVLNWEQVGMGKGVIRQAREGWRLQEEY